MAGRSGYLFKMSRLNHDKRQTHYIVNVIFRAARLRNCVQITSDGFRVENFGGDLETCGSGRAKDDKAAIW
jgi:hypothetical protein